MADTFYTIANVPATFDVTVASPVCVDIPIEGFSGRSPSGKDMPNGYGCMDCYFTPTGSGTLAAYAQCSNLDAFAVPTGFSPNIFTGLTAGGHFPLQFTNCKTLRLRFVATTGTVSITQFVPRIS